MKITLSELREWSRVQQGTIWKREGRRKFKECAFFNFPGSPGVKNPPLNAGDSGSIPGQGTKTLQAVGQLSQYATTTKPLHSGACAPKLEKSMSHNEDPGQLKFFF